MDLDPLLILQHPTYVCGVCEFRACVYACMPSIDHVCLCRFLEKKKYSQVKKERSKGMEDQNPY